MYNIVHCVVFCFVQYSPFLSHADAGSTLFRRCLMIREISTKEALLICLLWIHNSRFSRMGGQLLASFTNYGAVVSMTHKAPGHYRKVRAVELFTHRPQFQCFKCLCRKTQILRDTVNTTQYKYQYFKCFCRKTQIMRDTVNTKNINTNTVFVSKCTDNTKYSLYNRNTTRHITTHQLHCTNTLTCTSYIALTLTCTYYTALTHSHATLH